MRHDAAMLLEVRDDSGNWQGIAPCLEKSLEGVYVALEALPATVLATTKMMKRGRHPVLLGVVLATLGNFTVGTFERSES